MESRTWSTAFLASIVPGERQQPVGQGRLAVVDVGDDGEVADAARGSCRVSLARWVTGPRARPKAPARGPSAVELALVGGTTAHRPPGRDARPDRAWAPIRAPAPIDAVARGPRPRPTAHALPEDRRPRRARPRPIAQPSPSTACGPTRARAPDLDAGADDARGRSPVASGRPGAVGEIHEPSRRCARRAQRRAHAPVQQVDLGLAVLGRAADVEPVVPRRPSRRTGCRRRGGRGRTRARSTPTRPVGNPRRAARASMR